MKLHDAVEVEWNDAWASQDGHGETEIEEDHKPQRQVSVGVFLRRDRAGITIAGCRHVDFRGDQYYDRVLFVPAGMIVRVRRLKR